MEEGRDVERVAEIVRVNDERVVLKKGRRVGDARSE